MAGLGYLGDLDDQRRKDAEKKGFAQAATQAKQLVEWGVYEPAVTSCGLSANAFCVIFTRRKALTNVCTLGQLQQVVQDRNQRLIRIDLHGHSYVIEQIDTSKPPLPPRGNVYQSNMAVIGNSELGITLHKYLHEQVNPVALDGYLDELSVVTSSATDAPTRAKLYTKLYTTRTYRANPDVKPINTYKVHAARHSLEVRQVSYQSFQEKDVLNGVYTVFMAYAYWLKGLGKKNPFADTMAGHLLLSANQVRDIYYTRCGG